MKSFSDFLRVEAELYREFNQDSAEARLAAQEFMDSYAAKSVRYSSTLRGQMPIEDPVFADDGKDLGTLAKQAIASGSKDPLVILWHAETVLSGKEKVQAIDMAIERLIESKYPRGLRFLFLNQRQRAAPQERLADRRVREIDLYANIPSWFEFAAKYENAQRPAYTIVRQMFLVQPKLPQTDELIKVADKILDDESQDRWLAHMLAGFANHRKAWDLSLIHI